MKATPLAILAIIGLIGVLAQGSFAVQEPPYFDLMDMGWELTDPEDFEEAIIVYTRELKRYPPAQRPMTLMQRSVAYLNLKKYEEALQDAEAAIALLKPGHLLIPAGYMLQAYVYWETGQMDKVVHFMTKAMNLGIHRLTKEVQASPLFTDFAGESKTAKKAKESLDRNEGLNYYMRGSAYAALGRYEEAARDFSQVIEKYADEDGFLSRAKMWRCLGKPQKAIQDYTQILEKTPWHRAARLQRMRTFLAMKNYRAALEDAEFGREKNLEHPDFERVSADVKHADPGPKCPRFDPRTP